MPRMIPTHAKDTNTQWDTQQQKIHEIDRKGEENRVPFRARRR